MILVGWEKWMEASHMDGARVKVVDMNGDWGYGIFFEMKWGDGTEG